MHGTSAPSQPAERARQGLPGHCASASPSSVKPQRQSTPSGSPGLAPPSHTKPGLRISQSHGGLTSPTCETEKAQEKVENSQCPHGCPCPYPCPGLSPASSLPERDPACRECWVSAVPLAHVHGNHGSGRGWVEDSRGGLSPEVHAGLFTCLGWLVGMA